MYSTRFRWFADCQQDDLGSHAEPPVHSAGSRITETSRQHEVFISTIRGTNDDIFGIPALWLDIDMADDAHDKKNLPPTLDDAMDIVDNLQWSPSIIVHSGHGLQVHWKLREVLEFDTESGRKDATLLVRKFQAYIRSIFLSKRWTVDSVHELARVMRPPGTVNIKTQPHVPTRILYMDENAAYNISDFDDLPELEAHVTAKDGPQVAVNVDGLLLDPQANPPVDKMDALRENNAKFDATWEHKRRDFPSGDYSQSAYDQSLATLAALADWTDQEIVNLVLANRRKFRADPKLRKDYFKSLLANARRVLLKTRAHQTIENDDSFREEFADALNGIRTISVEQRERILEQTGHIWGFKLTRFVRTVGDPTTFRLETSCGRVEIGGSENLISQAKFRALVYNKTLQLIEKETQEVWDRTIRKLGLAAEDEDFGVEVTDTGLINGWMQQYLETHIPCDEGSDYYESEIEARQPFVKNGITCFFLDDLQNWIMSIARERINRKRVVQLIGLIGCTNWLIKVPKPQGARGSTTRYVEVLSNVVDGPA